MHVRNDTAMQKVISAWCSSDRNNSFSSLKQGKKIKDRFKHEKLHRKDNKYDIIVVIKYNFKKPIPFKGSAIFLHIARPRLLNTEGCIAIEKEEMIKLSQKIEIDTKLIIKP